MKYAAFSLLLLCSVQAIAKPFLPHSSPKITKIITVSGMVAIAGEQKQVEGIRITVKGTHHSTQTDNKGQYVLADVPTNAVLVYSYKQAKAQEYAVKGHTHIVVVLARKTAK